MKLSLINKSIIYKSVISSKNRNKYFNKQASYSHTNLIFKSHNFSIWVSINKLEIKK